ncbi:hypothetical protein [Bacillus sp. FSL H8-0515]|uniref:hypothetical protein n=1 Tax=Bacillus sp. FSL H8-0515 TaxID=2921396 RepID=UPI0030FC4183
MVTINQRVLKNHEDFEPPFLEEEASIKIEGLGSQKTLASAKGLLPALGNIHRITHFRNGKKIIFHTYIEADFNLLIKGGFTNNYTGVGPAAFQQFLAAAGLNQTHISSLSKDEEIVEIKIEF